MPIYWENWDERKTNVICDSCARQIYWNPLKRLKKTTRWYGPDDETLEMRRDFSFRIFGFRFSFFLWRVVGRSTKGIPRVGTGMFYVRR